MLQQQGWWDKGRKYTIAEFEYSIQVASQYMSYFSDEVQAQPNVLVFELDPKYEGVNDEQQKKIDR